MITMQSIIAQMKAEQAANKKEAESGRINLVMKMIDAGYDVVRVEFAGGGDSGSIEAITHGNADEAYNGKEISSPLKDEISDWCYKYLQGTGVDWYNNEGGQGHFLFDMRSIPYKFECSIDINVLSSKNAFKAQEVA